MMMTTNHERCLSHVDRDQWHASHMNKFHFSKTQISSVPSVNCVHSDALLSNSNLFRCFYVTRRTSFSFLSHVSCVSCVHTSIESDQYPANGRVSSMSILDVVHVVHSNVFFILATKFIVNLQWTECAIKIKHSKCLVWLHWSSVLRGCRVADADTLTQHNIPFHLEYQIHSELFADKSRHKPIAMSHLGSPPHEPNSLFSLKDK